ncbi:MAG: heparinase II/III domain-containing protein [Mycetocola sp.]
MSHSFSDTASPTATADRFFGPLRAQLAARDPRASVPIILEAGLAPAATALPLPIGDEIWGPGGSADPIAVDALTRTALAEASTPWPQPLASLAARVHSDGNRDDWEQRVFARQRRLSRAVIAALHTGQPEQLAAVLDGVIQLCEQSSWCWPAHDDAFSTSGAVLADVDQPFLDLGAGEVAGQLAVIDHVIGAQLEQHYPGTRARIRREVRERIVTPFTTRRDWHWIGLDGDVHNWNPWIHGNVLLAALRLLDRPEDTELRTHVVDLVVEGLDRYLVSLPDDGAIDEGYAYWWNGACRALEAVDVLNHALGGRLSIAEIPALRETVAFPHRMHLGGPWYLNLADGQARPPAAQPWHALHRAALAVGDDDAAAHARAHRLPGTPAATEDEGLPRLLRGLSDPAWVTATPAASPLPGTVWFESTQVLLARQTAGTSSGLTLAIKGGHNAEHHNHNDVGSFVVASDGVPALIDVGRPTYTAATFGPDRYSAWPMQSGWHNVPVLSGQEQPQGSDRSATAVSRVTDGPTTGLSLDLADVYRDSNTASWVRTAVIDRSTERIVIEDQWTTGDNTSAAVGTSVHLIIAGDITLGNGAAHITPLNGARPLHLRWDPVVPASLERKDLTDPMLSDVWGTHIHRLALTLAGQTHIRVVVEQDSSTEENAP